MSTVSGIGTTFNLPNYHGELIQISPTDTPLLSLAGGIGGGKQTISPRFEWQTEDLRDPEIRARLEGADAPTAEERARANVENVVQIFHESVETSYTKQASTGQYATPGTAPFYSADGTPNPVGNEHAHQVANALRTIARDVNFTFWHGVLNKPTTNETARQTAGLLSVCTTNAKVKAHALYVDAPAATDTITVTHDLVANDKVVFTDVGASTTIKPHRFYWVTSVSTTASFKIAEAKGGTAIAVGTATVSFYGIKAADTVSVDDVNALLQGAYDNGGISGQETATLFVPSGQKIGVSKAYAGVYGKTDALAGTRNVAGIAVETIMTDFGLLNIVLDRNLPADALAVVSMEQVDPVFLSFPDKGVLFEEALAKTGSSDKTQIYGEIGLQYGNEKAHAIARGFYA